MIRLNAQSYETIIFKRPIKPESTPRKPPLTLKSYLKKSVSRFQEKEKRGEMITINDNIK